MIYYLDTNICIYFLVGKYPQLLIKIMSFSPNDIKIPAIVKAELLHGAEKSLKRDENLAKISTFLIPFEIIPFDDVCTGYYGKIKASLEKTGMLIGPNDLIIAATTLAKNAILVTNNTFEFSRVEGLPTLTLWEADYKTRKAVD